MSDDDELYGTSSSPSSVEASASDYWDSDEALEFLKADRMVNPYEAMSTEQHTRKLLEDAAPLAAMSIINLAKSSGNDNTRLNAAKYIVDFQLQDQGANGKAKWEDMLGSIISEEEILGNSEGATSTEAEAEDLTDAPTTKDEA